MALNAEEIPAELEDEALSEEELELDSFTIPTLLGAFKPPTSGEEEPPPEHDEMKTENNKIIMLSPKRMKYRKYHRPRSKGVASRGNKIAFGDFALQALEGAWVTSRQIEAGRRSMSRRSASSSGH